MGQVSKDPAATLTWEALCADWDGLVGSSGWVRGLAADLVEVGIDVDVRVVLDSVGALAGSDRWVGADVRRVLGEVVSAAGLSDRVLRVALQAVGYSFTGAFWRRVGRSWWDVEAFLSAYLEFAVVELQKVGCRSAQRDPLACVRRNAWNRARSQVGSNDRRYFDARQAVMSAESARGSELEAGAEFLGHSLEFLIESAGLEVDADSVLTVLHHGYGLSYSNLAELTEGMSRATVHRRVKAHSARWQLAAA